MSHSSSVIDNIVSNANDTTNSATFNSVSRTPNTSLTSYSPESPFPAEIKHLTRADMIKNIVSLGIVVVELVGIGFLYKPIWKHSSVGQPLDLGKNKKFIQSAVVFLWIDVAMSLLMTSKYMGMVKSKPEESAVGFLSILMTVVWAVGLGYLTDLVFNNDAKITSTHLKMMKMFWVVYVVDAVLSSTLMTLAVLRGATVKYTYTYTRGAIVHDK